LPLARCSARSGGDVGAVDEDGLDGDVAVEPEELSVIVVSDAP
jgi:hypothetical protein